MPFFKMIENVSRHFSKSKKIRVALLIDEFFGGAGTAYGGYGFLARKFIAKYIPDEDIEIDVLLGKRDRVESGFAPRSLPHHRTCRSASGGF